MFYIYDLQYEDRVSVLMEDLETAEQALAVLVGIRHNDKKALVNYLQSPDCRYEIRNNENKRAK